MSARGILICMTILFNRQNRLTILIVDQGPSFVINKVKDILSYHITMGYTENAVDVA